MGSISHVHLLQSLEIFNSSVHQSDNIQIGSVLEKLPSQKTLSSILDDNLFRVLQGSLSIADRARLLSASSPHASSWLTVTPSEGQGLHLDPPVFQTALKWWLGLDTAEGSICALCPDKMLDPLGHHATTCKRGGDVVFRHNKLRDILAETCRRAHLSVQVEAGCNLTPDHSHSRPADVLISNWVLGKTAACDISVTSPLNSNIMSEAGVTAGAAAQATELRKHEANDVKCSELGWLCIPLVVESYGAWGKEAMESFSSLASRLAITSSRPKSAVLSELYGRLNLNLVRANSLLWLLESSILHGESRVLIHRSSAADAAALLPLIFVMGRGLGWRRERGLGWRRERGLGWRRERGLAMGRAVATGAVVLAAGTIMGTVMGTVRKTTLGGDVLALDFGFLTTLLGALAE
ncbi:hypothetical protein EMCRGX_G008263 [Ephydatia muelleri]